MAELPQGDPRAAEGPDRLDDEAVRERLTRIDDLLERVEQVPGPTLDAAIEAVQALTEVYGEALARVLAAASPEVVGTLVSDELLSHLLVLHQIHPDPLERRVSRAVDELRSAVQKEGGEVELAGIDGDVANLRLRVKGCGSSGVEDAVRETIMAIAPELTEVTCSAGGDDHVDAFVPLESLLRRPATVSGGS
jgi:Fe-S cluster biogenesis protein NfuA